MQKQQEPPNRFQAAYDKLQIGNKIRVLHKFQNGDTAFLDAVLMDKYLILDKGDKNNVFIDVMLGNGIIIEYYGYFVGNQANVQIP